MKTALLLIDIQNDYFKGGRSELTDPDSALANARKVLNDFRKQNMPVIHVQHINTRDGATFFLPNTEGAEIHKELTPRKNEFLGVKHYPNSFYETDLHKIIEDNDITNLVVCGMMTHMCIDTTVRAARDYGLCIFLLDDACATKNLLYNGEVITATIVHKTFMSALNGMFADVIKTADFDIDGQLNCSKS